MTDLQVIFYNIANDGICKHCKKSVKVKTKEGEFLEPYVVFSYGTSRTSLVHGQCFEDFCLEHAVKSGRLIKRWPW